MLNKISGRLNGRGVTLVEVMISLVIMLVVFMGLIQASLLSINHNVRNEIRDEAVRVAAEFMARTRAEAFSSLTHTGTFVAFPNTPSITRNFRNLSREFRVDRQILRDITAPDTIKIGIRVRWLYPDDDPALPVAQWQQHTIYYTMRSPA